jgi:hypothetical protein
VLGHVAMFGVAREADEGPLAHIWQLLMAGQMPVLAFFAIKWLPRAPRQTLYVLAIQAGPVLAAMTPCFFSPFVNRDFCMRVIIACMSFKNEEIDSLIPQETRLSATQRQGYGGRRDDVAEGPDGRPTHVPTPETPDDRSSS